MTVFGFHIRARFWVILGAIIVLIAGFVWFKGQQPEPYDPLTQPAFSPSKLGKLGDSWIDPYISYFGVRDPETSAPIANLTENLGTPFRFRVLLPSVQDASTRPDLNLIKYGWQFQPAVFLPPTEAITENLVSEKLGDLENGTPIMMGFPRGSVPTGGGFYEITGLLYWHSILLKGPSQDGYGSAPVVLAASARPLNSVELMAPATHKANLNITYRQSGMQVTLKSLEWASGKQVRLCMSIANVATRAPMSAWGGLNGFRAYFPQASGQASTSGAPDEFSPLGETNVMDYLSPVSGYIVFDAPPASEPDASMQLFVPSINTNGPPTIVSVRKRQFRQMSTQDHSVRSGTDEGCYQPQ